MINQLLTAGFSCIHEYTDFTRGVYFGPIAIIYSKVIILIIYDLQIYHFSDQIMKTFTITKTFQNIQCVCCCQ